MTREITLSTGNVTLVDESEFEWLNQWRWNEARGYAMRIVSTNGKRIGIYMARFILDAPEGMHVDHISGDILDNRRVNLRICTATENSRNSKKRTNGTSQYKGVGLSQRVHGGKWRAQIRIDGKVVILGLSDDEIELAHIYDAAAREHFGPFARCNFEVNP